MLDASNAQQTSHRTRRTTRICRLGRALLVALATAVALSTPAMAAAKSSGTSLLRDKKLIIAVGKGKVTGELPFCFNGAPGPCGWIVQGTHQGTPIRSGTFFAAIDNGGAASPHRCVPATYSGLLYETPDDAITQASEGKICPTGAGGYVFTGRAELAGVPGRFGNVTSGRGHLRMTVAANGSTTLTLTGHIRISEVQS